MESGRSIPRGSTWARSSNLSRRLQGFTLIELLLVFVLMAMLLTIAVPRYLQTAEAAKEKVRAQNLATLRDALDKFKADQGRYPTALVELVQKQYLRQVPQDPVTRSDQWIPIGPPGGAEVGVYDVAPPTPQQQPEPASGNAGAPPPADQATATP